MPPSASQRHQPPRTQLTPTDPAGSAWGNHGENRPDFAFRHLIFVSIFEISFIRQTLGAQRKTQEPLSFLGFLFGGGEKCFSFNYMLCIR